MDLLIDLARQEAFHDLDVRLQIFHVTHVAQTWKSIPPAFLDPFKVRVNARIPGLVEFSIQYKRGYIDFGQQRLRVPFL